MIPEKENSSLKQEKLAARAEEYQDPVAAASVRSKSLRNFRPLLTSGRTDLQQLTRDIVNSRSDYLANNDSIGGMIIGRFCDYVIADGLWIKPNINWKKAGITEAEASELQDTFEEDFHEWAESKESDLFGERSFYEAQYESYRNELVYGEIFFSIPHSDEETEQLESSMRHQTIDPNRVCNQHNSMDTKSVVAGIEFDSIGRAKYYWILDKHPGDVTDIAGAITWKKYAVYDADGKRQIFHNIRQRRKTDDVRGIGILALVIDRIFDSREYRNAELLSAKQQAKLTFGWFSDDENDPFENVKQDPNLRLEQNETTLHESTMLSGSTEDRLELFQPSRPNTANYVPFMEDIKKEISAAEGIPHQVMEMLFDASFSASKAAINQWIDKVLLERNKFSPAYCHPHYVRFIDEGVLTGRYKIKNYWEKQVRNAITRGVWQGRTIKDIDEGRAMSAAKTRLDSKITSKEEERNYLGLDNDLMKQQIQREEDERRRKKNDQTST